jgi:hypothetical protein
MKEGSPMATDPWADAPETSVPTPFITRRRRAQLVNTRATVQVTGADYMNDGRFGPKFTMTCVHPDGDEFRISFSTNSGKSPRDQINKWMWEKLRKGGTPIPASICKRGNSYYLDAPGAESDQDMITSEDSSWSADEPEF